MEYSILVTQSPFAAQTSKSAYFFCQALLSQGHSIQAVFFFQDGIHNANCFAQEQSSCIPSWNQLTQKHRVKLLVCSTAATERGVLNQSAAQAAAYTDYNLAADFHYASLAEFLQISLGAERLIQF